MSHFLLLDKSSLQMSSSLKPESNFFLLLFFFKWLCYPFLLHLKNFLVQCNRFLCIFSHLPHGAGVSVTATVVLRCRLLWQIKEGKNATLMVLLSSKILIHTCKCLQVVRCCCDVQMISPFFKLYTFLYFFFLIDITECFPKGLNTSGIKLIKLKAFLAPTL